MEAVQKYFALIAADRFADAYRLLALDARERIDAEAFVQRHQDIWAEATITGLRWAIVPPPADNVAGVEVDLVYETDFFGDVPDRVFVPTLRQPNWVLDWTPDVIFDGLGQPGTLVHRFIDVPVRGDIFDRNGQPLAVKGEQAVIGISHDLIDTRDEDLVVDTFVEKLHLDETAVRNLVFQDVPSYYFIPIVRLEHNASPALIAEFEQLAELGILVRRETIRLYPQGETAAHIIGFMGEINPEELAELEVEGFRPGDPIGRDGAEAIFESTLAGDARRTTDDHRAQRVDAAAAGGAPIGARARRVPEHRPARAAARRGGPGRGSRRDHRDGPAHQPAAGGGLVSALQPQRLRGRDQPGGVGRLPGGRAAAVRQSGDGGDLRAGLDVQGRDGRGRAGGARLHARNLPALRFGLVRPRARRAAEELEGGRRRQPQPAPGAGRELQHVLLPGGAGAAHAGREPAAGVHGGLRLRAGDRRAGTHRGPRHQSRPRVEAPQPQRLLVHRRHGQRQHRPGLPRRDADADRERLRRPRDGRHSAHAAGRALRCARRRGTS